MTPVWGYSSPDTKHFGPAAGSPARPTRQPELSPTEEGLPGSRGRSSRESSTRRPPVTTSCQMGRPCPCHRRGLRCGQPPCWPTAQSTACRGHHRLGHAPRSRCRPRRQLPGLFLRRGQLLGAGGEPGQSGGFTCRPPPAKCSP